MAMVKRFAQVLVSGRSGATEFVVGGLYLLGEVGRSLILSTIIICDVMDLAFHYCPWTSFYDFLQF